MGYSETNHQQKDTTMLTNLKTMALLIDVDTYPVAVACLPPTFATIPTSKVFGHWLVINELETKWTKKGTKQTLVVSNSWMNEYLFTTTYELGKMLTDNWYLVKKIEN